MSDTQDAPSAPEEVMQNGLAILAKVIARAILADRRNTADADADLTRATAGDTEPAPDAEAARQE